MKDDLDKASKRSLGYWFVDGIAEIAIGVMLMAVGLLLLGEGLVPSGSPLRAVSAFALPVIVIGGWYVLGRLVRAAKERITYPRTGFVSYRQRSARSRRRRALIAGIASGVTAGIVVALALNYTEAFNLIPIMQGVIIGAFWAFMGWRFGILRFYPLGALSFLFGLFAAGLPLDSDAGTGIYFALIGVAVLVSGAVTLWLYLRQNSTAGEGTP